MTTKYTPSTMLKAIMAGVVAAAGAATVSAGGPDLSVLDFGQILGALGAGLAAFAATFSVPNRATESPEDQVIRGIEQVRQNKSAADAAFDRIRDGAGDLIGAALDPIVKQAIDAVNRVHR